MRAQSACDMNKDLLQTDSLALLYYSLPIVIWGMKAYIDQHRLLYSCENRHILIMKLFFACVWFKNIRHFRENRLSLYNKHETLPKIYFVLKNKMILTNTVFQQHTVNKWSDICFASASRPEGGSHVSSIITGGRFDESSS